MLAPLRNKSAQSIANVFYDKWVCTFGCPKLIVTDRGTKFCNELLDELIKKLGGKHTRTTANHPQTNGQAEIFNKTLNHYLRSFTEQNRRSWSKTLPSLTFMHNTAEHSSTGVTPSSLISSFNPSYPDFDPDNAIDNANPLDPSIRMDVLRQTAIQKNQTAIEKYTLQYNKKSKHITFKVNDKVLIYNPPNLDVAYERKFRHFYTGPHTIIELIKHKSAIICDDNDGTLSCKHRPTLPIPH